MKSVFQSLMRKVWPLRPSRVPAAPADDDLPAVCRRSEAFAEDLGDLVAARVFSGRRRRGPRRRASRAAY